MNANTSHALNPELQMICTILDQLDVPRAIDTSHRFEGTHYAIRLERVGLNPGMALGVLRHYGVKGIQHAAPTLYFWNTSGAPKAVCDDFKATHGAGVFDLIQEHMRAADTRH